MAVVKLNHKKPKEHHRIVNKLIKNITSIIPYKFRMTSFKQNKNPENCSSHSLLLVLTKYITIENISLKKLKKPYINSSSQIKSLL